MKHYFVYYGIYNETTCIGEGSTVFDCDKFDLSELIAALLPGLPGATTIVIRYLVEL